MIPPRHKHTMDQEKDAPSQQQQQQQQLQAPLLHHDLKTSAASHKLSHHIFRLNGQEHAMLNFVPGIHLG